MKDKKQSTCVGCFFVIESKLPREDCEKIPIVAMSANAFEEDVKLSLASGMNGHLSKPVNIQKLEEILGALIS